MENNKINGNENITKKKGLFIEKDNDLNDLIKVKDFFEDPNQYFIKDKKMIIGKMNLNESKQLKNRPKIKSFSLSETSHNKLNINKVNKLKLKTNVISKSKSFTQGQTPPQSIKKSNLISSGNSRPKTSLSRKKIYKYNTNLNPYLNNLRISSEHIRGNIGIHYERKSINEVLKLLEKSKSREEENKNKNEDLLPKDVKEELKQNFSEQEKILNNKNIIKNKSDFLSKILSKKLKRKEDELLFNKIEEFRLKKQLIEYIENSKSLRDKFGNNYWIADLRRPKIQNEIRYNYFNNGNKYNYPDKIIDYADKKIEFINNPYRLKKNKYANLLRNLSINNFIQTNTGIKIPNIEKMNEIGIIKGKSLIEQEYLGIVNDQNNINNKRIFKLYKDPSESKSKNVKDFVYRENYNDLKFYKNKSCKINNYNKYSEKISLNNKSKKNKKSELFRSQSQIEENKDDKNKNNYLKEAMKIFKKENQRKYIKIIGKY